MPKLNSTEAAITGILNSLPNCTKCQLIFTDTKVELGLIDSKDKVKPYLSIDNDKKRFKLRTAEKDSPTVTFAVGNTYTFTIYNLDGNGFVMSVSKIAKEKEPTTAAAAKPTTRVGAGVAYAKNKTFY